MEEIVESIDTRDLYRTAFDATIAALTSAARDVYDLPEGNYWGGVVMDALLGALKPIIEQEVEASGLARKVFVRVVQVDGDHIVNAGGAFKDLGGHSAYFDINLPKVWLTGEAKMFIYVVRASGNSFAHMLAKAISHEAIHMHQLARGDGHAATRSTALGDDKYLTSKAEIAAQADSAALELVNYMGPKALSLFQKSGAEKLAQIIDAEWVAPHLTSYWRSIRSDPDAWKLFLKTVYARLKHHS